MVGDITPIELEQSQVRRTSKTGEFQYFRWDAEHLPVRNNSVDMIWDRKGWLWHCANKKDVGRFLATIDQYRNLLKDGGCIVVDNIAGFSQVVESMSPGEEMHSLLSALFALGRIKKIAPSELVPKRIANQYEPSTVDNIDKLSSAKEGDIWGKLMDKFEVVDLGYGAERIRILRKKRVLQS